MVQRDDRVWNAPKLDSRVRRVCQVECNGGWMSRLEGEAAPILTPMILAEQPTIELRPEAQLVLARWVLKTALMADFLYAHRVFGQEWYSGYYEHRHPPDQCVIWTAAYLGKTAAVHLRRADAFVESFPLAPDGEVLGDSAAKASGVLVTFNVFRVVFQVLAYGGGVYFHPGTSPTDDITHRIWPVSGATLQWPPHGRALGDTGLVSFATRFGAF